MEKKDYNDDLPSTFEEAINELELIIQKLEEGNVTLDQSLELFKRGISLTNFCTNKLNEAQGLVKILSRNKDGEVEEMILDNLDTE